MRKYAALTMVRDETLYLKLWHRYYSEQFGAENLFIIDHNSKTYLPEDVIGQKCNVFRFPFDNSVDDPDGQLRLFDNVRFKFISDQVRSLLRYYDCVILNDADEIFFIDGPMGLRDYLDSLDDISFRCGIGAEVMHHTSTEEAYDLDKSLFEQRRFFHYNLNFCKPWIFGKPAEITGHGAYQPFHIDPNILLLHLHWLDYETSIGRHRLREEAFASGRGQVRSRWSKSVTELDDQFKGEFKGRFEATRMSKMPHRGAMEELLPNYSKWELSNDNFKRFRRPNVDLIKVTFFMNENQRNKFQRQAYKFPEGFKSSFV